MVPGSYIIDTNYLWDGTCLSFFIDTGVIIKFANIAKFELCNNIFGIQICMISQHLFWLPNSDILRRCSSAW
jgi:hypothetical protein